MRSYLVLFLLIAGCLSNATRLWGTVRRVPSEYATIQTAITASADHDTVLVSPGRYYENIDFRGRNIVVAGEFLSSNDPLDIVSTIIDGSQPVHEDTASCVLLISGEDSTAQLVGFTLTGGSGTALVDQDNGLTYVEGGGVIIEEANPVVRNNFIVANSATRVPQGISSAGGGGVRAGFGGATITGNVIIGNTGRYGAGVVVNYDDTRVTNNIIAMNSGGQDYGGGGLWLNGNTQTCTAANNTIVGNFSAGRGGGIRGGGMTLDGTNNVVWGNRSVQIGPQISGNAVTHCEYCCVAGGYTGEGNITEHPDFVATALALAPQSPCRNAGHPDSLYNDRDGSRNDIGSSGGPDAALVPDFNWSDIYFADNLVGFAASAPGVPVDVSFVFENRGISGLWIESAEVREPIADVVSILSFPNLVMPFLTDSIRFRWTPEVEFIDTAYVFHSDTTIENPLQLILHGTIETSAREHGSAALGIQLSEPWPNPFNSATSLDLDLPYATHATVEVFDLLGRKVATLTDQQLDAGLHPIRWQPADLATGQFIIRANISGRLLQRNVILLK